MSDRVPAIVARGAVADALGAKLHWLRDDERANELADTAIRALIAVLLDSTPNALPIIDLVAHKGVRLDAEQRKELGRFYDDLRSVVDTQDHGKAA